MMVDDHASHIKFLARSWQQCPVRFTALLLLYSRRTKARKTHFWGPMSPGRSEVIPGDF